ncbi:MAG: RNA polymerase sigma factor [Chitinophagales bacterium]
MNNITQLEQNKQYWVNQVKNGDSKALESLYRAYRKEFILWLSLQSACTEEMALDIFQESILALYKNAKAGHLDEMRSSIKTYLFAIGRKIFIRQNQRKKLKVISLEEELGGLKELKAMPTQSDSLTKRQKLISKLLPKLRLVCQDILVMYYYKNMNMKDIAEEQNYRSTNVAKVMKSRCMESFRKLVYNTIKANKLNDL